MNFDLQPGLMMIVYVVVFVGTLLAFEGVRHLLSGNETASEARNRRMNMLAGGKGQKETYDLLRRDSQSSRRFSLDGIRDFPQTLQQAGFNYGLPAFFLMTLALGASVYLLATTKTTMNNAILIACISTAAFPFIYVHEGRRKRTQKLERQLPDALDQMARGLKVGHPLNVTVGNVANEMADPIGTEFGLIQDQVAFGDDIVSAFNDFAERIDSEDASNVAVCVSIQHGTGGNLAHVLQILANVVRDRATMRRKISAISAEGRLSALILSVLPFAIFASVHTSAPSFYGDVWEDPMFIKAAAIVVTLVVVQAIVLYRLVNFKF